MRKVRFTHEIVVPNNREQVVSSDGYAEELSDVKVFELTQEEYEELRKSDGLFDAFDKTFGTIIDDCEEDRIPSERVMQALELTMKYAADNSAEITSGLSKIIQSLEYARNVGVFWEIINGVELDE